MQFRRGFAIAVVLTVFPLATRTGRDAARPGAVIATRRHTAQAAMSVLLYPAAAILAVLFGVLLSIGSPFTALAGNPPVHAGDEDAIVTIGGLVAGLLVAWTAWMLERPAGTVRASFDAFERSMDRRFMP